MYNNDRTSNLNFKEEDKFLENILELRQITARLLKNRDEMNVNLEKLDHTVRSLYNEIRPFDNK